MKRWLTPILLLAVALGACQTGTGVRTRSVSENRAKLERVIVSPNGHGFVLETSGRPFHPWGFNYGNQGQLMEDFWDADWATFAHDFQKMKALGANTVRVHLQYGKFMDGPDKPNAQAFQQLRRMVRLAEESGLYLDVTGLACYRAAEVPQWYDALDESARWKAQAAFWEAVAAECATSPAVFCYDLMNEPMAPAGKREAGQWLSGKPFGGLDFVQFISLDPAGRVREEIPLAWIKQMSAAIHRRDTRHLVTVGMLPWMRDWKHLSGFVPARVASEVDFLSVHLYPDTKKAGEALEALKQCDVGKPVVIEETFQLSCSILELESFLRATSPIACGWVGHYDGMDIDEVDAAERAGKMTIKQSIYRDFLHLFVRLGPEFRDATR